MKEFTQTAEQEKTWNDSMKSSFKPQLTDADPIIFDPRFHDVRIYSQWQSVVNNSTLCIITKEGRILRDGVDITDNDSAVAACFIEWLKKVHNIEVKRGN